MQSKFSVAGRNKYNTMAYRKIEEYDEKTTQELAGHVKAILKLLGEDPEREGLVKTPERVAKAWQFLTQGYGQNGETIVRSACEHHMLPFIGKAHVAYIPNGRITGLSKIARVVETYARRLQVQERLTEQIRDCIQESLHPLGVAVVIEAMHTCMSMRGVEKSNAVTTTSAFSGIFLKSFKTRNEFLQLIGK